MVDKTPPPEFEDFEAFEKLEKQRTEAKRHGDNGSAPHESRARRSMFDDDDDDDGRWRRP